MGRTKRERKKKQKSIENKELTNIINLQKSLKIKCPHIKINFFNNTGWGIKCKKKINKGDVIIALPLQHLITPKVTCDVFSVTNIKNKPPQFILSVFLVFEQHLKEKSKYFKYIASLPKTFTNPYFCTDNEINLLPYIIKSKVNEQKQLISNLYDELINEIKNESCMHCGKNLENIYTKDKFEWAWFIVNTRSVFYKDENDASLALAPFLDFFNHSNEAETQMFIDFENELYVLKTLNRYKKNEQVFIKYGAHSNLKLYVEYGFWLVNNANDFIKFSFEDVINCVKEYDYESSLFYHHLLKEKIPKLKYDFIKSNNLNANLVKYKTEFSWTIKSLIYVLITNDQNLSIIQSKTYSHSFNPTEKDMIDEIEQNLLRKKLTNLQNILEKMKKLEKCTPNFYIAQNLIKNYINDFK